MASTDSRPVPRKNVAFRYYFAIRKSDGTLITSWAGQDSEVDKDGAGFSDCTNEATEIGSSGVGYIDLTSTEMNADAVNLKVTVTNTGALPVVVTFFPEEVGDYRANVEQFGGSNGTFSGGRPEVNTTHIGGTVQTANDVGADVSATLLAVQNIAIGTASVNTVAASYTLTTGTQSSGAFASTHALDGTTHQHTDDAGAMDLFYEFDVGDSGIPVSAKVTGRLSGTNDTLGVYAYNWVGASWDQIGSLVGSASTVLVAANYDLLSAHVGTGSDAGKVRIRYYEASGLTTATLYIDQILVAYAQSVAGIPNGSTITLSSSAANRTLIGHNWVLALGGQNVAGAYVFQSTNVTGTGTGTNGAPFTFQECAFGAATLAAFGLIDKSALTSTLTLTSTSGGSADALTLVDCLSGIPGSGSPTIDASGVTKTTGLGVRHWRGGLTAVLNAFVTATLEGSNGNGTVTCTTGGGNAEIRGGWKAVVITTSGSSVTNIVVWSGCPITIDGTGGTVNIYGVHGVVTSDATGTTVNDYGMAVAAVPAILEDTGTTLQAELDGIQADTEDIQSRLPAALTGDGNIKADTLRVGGTLQTAGDLKTLIDAKASQASVDDLPTNAELATALGTADDAVLAAIAALNNLSAAAVNAEVDTAISDAALATAANLAVVAGYLDTEIAAIKAKTDSLTFTQAGHVDANVQRVNDVALTGDGGATPWGPA